MVDTGKTHQLVMVGHSRSQNGVASLAYVPAIHDFEPLRSKDVDARHKAGHDESGIRHFFAGAAGLSTAGFGGAGG
jgi:hypothetical protein